MSIVDDPHYLHFDKKSCSTLIFPNLNNHQSRTSSFSGTKPNQKNNVQTITNQKTIPFNQRRNVLPQQQRQRQPFLFIGGPMCQFQNQKKYLPFNFPIYPHFRVPPPPPDNQKSMNFAKNKMCRTLRSGKIIPQKGKLSINEPVMFDQIPIKKRQNDLFSNKNLSLKNKNDIVKNDEDYPFQLSSKSSLSGTGSISRENSNISSPGQFKFNSPNLGIPSPPQLENYSLLSPIRFTKSIKPHKPLASHPLLKSPFSSVNLKGILSPPKTPNSGKKKDININVEDSNEEDIERFSFFQNQFCYSTPTRTPRRSLFSSGLNTPLIETPKSSTSSSNTLNNGLFMSPLNTPMNYQGGQPNYNNVLFMDNFGKDSW